MGGPFYSVRIEEYLMDAHACPKCLDGGRVETIQSGELTSEFCCACGWTSQSASPQADLLEGTLNRKGRTDARSLRRRIVSHWRGWAAK
jgi:hypothetical protein